MDYRERFEDRQGALRSAMNGHQAQVWTALPGIITSYDPQTITAQVQPSVSALFTGPDQKTEWVNLPVCPDVPVIFPRGGNYALTFPIAQGDECLLVFSSRCIDNWWQQGGVQTQRELRMHDLSDGFAIPGPWSQATKISNLSTTTTQLRTSDGTIYAEIDGPNKKGRLISNGITIEADSQNSVVNITGANTVNIDAQQSVNVSAQQQATITAPNVTIAGNLDVTGNLRWGTNGTPTNAATHRHGVTGTPAAAQTIPPTPGT